MLLALLALHFNAVASHTFGGELLYTYLSGNTYKVSLTIYGDCAAVSTNQLPGARPEIQLYNGTVLVNTFTLSLEAGSAVEVSPVCDDEINNTSCKLPGSPLPGVKRFVYSEEITIPVISANWRFVFQGAFGNSLAGRANSITNVVIPPGGSLMYLEALLNNSSGPNSSPQFTSLPTPFLCANKEQQYNQGAADSNGDSLVFSLTPALEENGSSVTYISPATGTNPLSTVAGSFSFNPENGQMSFIADRVQKSVVVNKVDEYKNGVLVGSSMREMTFIVLDNCANSSPDIKAVDSLLGGVAITNSTVNVCEGADSIYFVMPATDADGNNIEINVTNIPPGAFLEVVNNNTPNPMIRFAWKISEATAGIYNLFMNMKDDACPISSNQTNAFTIRIVKQYAVSQEIEKYTNCISQAQLFKLLISGGITPYFAQLYKNGGVMRTYADSSSRVITEKLVPGSYSLHISSSALLCETIYDFNVADTGIYPVPVNVTDQDLCLNDPVTYANFPQAATDSIAWYSMEGLRLDDRPTYNTNSPGIYSWQVSQFYKNCESERDTFTVTVHDLPGISIATKPGKVCLGDVVYLSADGANTYRWLPADKIETDVNNSPYTKVMAPATFTVIGANEYGCTDTAAIAFNEVENCCSIFYPTAFTPNGDGQNDGFRALLYGNEADYTISIFNRWGQCVFTSHNPKQAWDGNFGGKPCEVGIYFYRVSGKCLTGQPISQKGDVMLLR
jgi:gliding motility-associated-like protein